MYHYALRTRAKERKFAMSEFKEKEPRRYPEECPARPEKYTREFVAIDHIELGGPLELDRRLDGSAACETFSNCHRHKTQESRQERAAHDACVRQDSDYHTGDKAAPDNNLFFEERSNPLSSKGNE